MSAFSKVYSKEREGFVESAAVYYLSSNEVTNASTSNGGCEAMNETELVGILPESLVSIRSKVEEDSSFIKVMVVNEFDLIRSLFLMIEVSRDLSTIEWVVLLILMSLVW